MERNENTSVTCRGNTSSAISLRCNQGTFDGGATYRQYPTNQSLPPSIQRAVVGSRCINVRHADGHSRAAPTCSDTRVAAGLNPSFAMCVEDRLPGSGIWIGTKEPCSAEDHHNRDQHRNDVGSSLGLTKTHFPHHRSNSWMTNSRATYKMPFVTTGPACGHTWSTDQCRRDITGG